ncbi:MAG TPA: glycoside hydrolase family 15 protein [Gammaproteobacteria bacterium]|nr:glycoside hydrolase family 15 protein [Gammaproteobacteria bacterium]
MKTISPQPAISDYAHIGDCHSSALISKRGSIDWCCMPRIDNASCFGRLLDWENGGFCQLVPKHSFETARSYIDGTMILQTLFTTEKAQARLIDFFPMRKGGSQTPHQQIIRIVEGIHGKMKFNLHIAPRFDYGAIKPWIRRYKYTSFIALGGSNGLLISGDMPMRLQTPHQLTSTFYIESQKRLYLSLIYRKPEELDAEDVEVPAVDELDWRLYQTQNWWRNWISQGNIPQSFAVTAESQRKSGMTEQSSKTTATQSTTPTTDKTSTAIASPYAALLTRSALVLKALSNAPTGAIAAAATTSLPECHGGSRNWDYRYSWIRDSYFTVRALSWLGFDKETDGFRRFIERSSHSSTDGLKTLYGVGGETRLHEYTLPELSGFHGAKPIRVGNAAIDQLQLDIFGGLLDLALSSVRSGNSLGQDYWKFLMQIISTVNAVWHQPDCGIWEMRCEPRHFVHSKVMCWVALDRGIKLTEVLNKDVPLEQWRQTREAIRKAVEENGYDKERGVFIQAFGYSQMDAALLLLPMWGFLEYTDQRIVRTVDAIMQDLSEDGLLHRYPIGSDGLEGVEGVFLPCSFWLVICLARQGRLDLAHEIFQRTIATGNELGLFSEEYDTKGKEMLGNFPQALTHLSLIAAALNLQRAELASSHPL